MYYFTLNYKLLKILKFLKKILINFDHKGVPFPKKIFQTDILGKVNVK